MQSILQYRRLGRRVETHLHGDHSLAPEHGSIQASPFHSLSHDQAAPRNLTATTSALFEVSHATRNEDDFIVTLDGETDFNPREWSTWRKLSVTTLVLSAGVVGGWASANDSTIIVQAMKTYSVSDVTESLSTGIYLVAFGVGSLFSGPFSEAVGRNPIYLITLILFMLFIFGSAMAQNIGGQLVCRFFAGIFGCTAVTTFAGSTADMWNPTERGLVYSTSTTVNFFGVFLAPVVGGFIGQSHNLSWRWTEWIALLLSAFATTLIFFFAPETNAAIIQSWKARHLRRLTGNPVYRAALAVKSERLGSRLLNSAYRPFGMLVHEITIVLFTLYLTVLYIVTFTFLTGYTFIYTNIYGFSQSSTGLCFLGLGTGIIIAGVIGIPIQHKYLRDLSRAPPSTRIPPESRLWYAIITAPCLPVGLFWMAWTSRVSISYWSSLTGSVLIGISFVSIFVSVYLYLIDMFESKAASALAVATFIRYVAAGAMVPVSIPMYRKLGVDWTLTVLGCISLLLTPLPFLFYRYGYAMRKTSRSAARHTT